MAETNPVALTADLKEVLARYIATTLPISARYPLLAQRFRSLLAQQDLVKGPFVEALPDFEKGVSLEQLLQCNGGFLHDGLGLLPFAARPLHKHQEVALRSAVKDRQSLLVATGTGSGKTETFLLPLLHHLLSDPEPHRPGVRALLIYPMNALANDQLYYRIAPMLARYLLQFGITFGRYTGQVKAGVTRVDEALELLNNGKLMQELGGPRDIPNNWLLTRDEMLADPPKVLITNYAMLEHLLLLPRNAPLFKANALRFIVLDEIHTYSGAQATEVAFLLRKLKNRLGVVGRLQVFGTSASLSSSEEANEDLKAFASRLLGETVSQVVRGRRITHAALTAVVPTFTLPTTVWIQLGRALECFLGYTVEEQTASAWNDCLDRVDCPDSTLRCSKSTGASVVAFLLERFAANEEVRTMAQLLDQGRVIHFAELARQCFAASKGAQSEREVALSAVVRLGMVARRLPSEYPLLPARYHIAANSIEGLALLPGSEDEGWSDVRVARHHRSERGLYFPLLTCRKCGQPFIEGWRHAGALHTRRPDSTEAGATRMVFWLGQPVSGTEDEEDETEVGAGGGATANREWMDPKTGELGVGEDAVALYPVQTEEDEVERAHYVKRCPACGGRSSGSDAEVVTRMHPGDEALGAVVTQRVLEALPPRDVKDNDPKPALGRGLLTFSDNRQDAAFFAPYLERTAADIALRAAVRQVFKETHTAISLPQLAEMVFDFWQKDGGQPLLLDSFGEIKTDRGDVTTLLKNALAREFCTPGGRRNSLESLGVVFVTFDETKLRELEQKVRLFWPVAFPSDSATVRAMIHLLLESVRRDRALASLHGISMKDESIWGEYNQSRSFELEAGDPNVKFKWLPGATGLRHNRRSWYLVERLGLPRANAREFLSRFWDMCTRAPNSVLARLRPGYGLVGELLRYRSGDGVALYRCASCGLLQRQVMNKCCSAFNCRGEVAELDTTELGRMRAGNHYLALYEERNHLTLRAREHTASLSTKLREEVERQFANKSINLLSCTTTMEMGVDLGDLEAVVNLNVPPGVANYQQRTGRAGRRAQAAPFCVTVARNTNYDQAAYRDLENYLSMTPRTPFVNLANSELFVRHQVSVVMSHFFRSSISNKDVNAPSLKHLFGDAFDSNQFRVFMDELRHWLEASPGKVALDEAEHLGALLPEDHTTIPTRGAELRLAIESRLTEFALDIVGRCSDYRRREEDASKQSRHKEAAYWQLQREKYMDQYLVTELSRRGMIPTYSFPVHSLTLEVRDGTSGGEFNRQADVALSRDASLGISEYAPGAEVVANGRIWESAGLARYPRAFMPTRWYSACQECYHVDTADTAADVPASCSNCGSDTNRSKRMFVEPKGFVTSSAKYRGRDPGTSRRRMRPADEARLIASPRPEEFEATELDFLRTAFLPAHANEKSGLRGSLFVANRGAYGLGYNRCLWCDFAEPKKRVRAAARRGAGAAPASFTHSDPLTGKPCGYNTLPKLGLDFAHRFDTDVRLLRFLSPLPEPQEAQADPRLYQERVARTLAEALRHATTDLMSLQPNELRSTFRLYSSLGNTLEVVLYDSVPGGAGYCLRLGGPLFSMTKLLQQMRNRLECPSGCDSGCRMCLCDYGNQRYWDSFERKDALAWLVSTLEGTVIGIGPGSYLPWKTPSLTSLADRFAPQTSVSLVGTALCAIDGHREQDLLQLKKWMDSGKTVRLYIAGHIEKQPRDYATLSLYRHLYPYAVDGRLKLFTVDGLSRRVVAELPRIYGTLESGAPIVKQAFPLQPLLSGLIAEPAFVGAMDEAVAVSVRALVDRAAPCDAGVFGEGDAMQMWEFRVNEPRDLWSVFAALKGAYIREMVIRDPYCGAVHNRARVGQLVVQVAQLAEKVERVTVHAVETKDRQGRIEHRYDVVQALEALISQSGVQNREAFVLSLGTGGRSFHDRDVTFDVIKKDGATETHRYFLSGGVDYLLDVKSATRVFYARVS